MTLIHEVREGQHRIVSVQEDGTNTTGEWVEQREVAKLDKWYVIYGEHTLPQGVFTVKVVPHQVLA